MNLPAMNSLKVCIEQVEETLQENPYMKKNHKDYIKEATDNALNIVKSIEESFLTVPIDSFVISQRYLGNSLSWFEENGKEFVIKVKFDEGRKIDCIKFLRTVVDSSDALYGLRNAKEFVESHDSYTASYSPKKALYVICLAVLWGFEFTKEVLDSP